MRILIVEDDFVSRLLLQKMLTSYGMCEIAVDGQEAVDAFKMALEEKNPYDFICLDIMMPGMDGREALKQIRSIEKEKGIGGFDHAKIIMTTALKDTDNVMGSFKDQCDGYIVKPIDKQKLLGKMIELGLISNDQNSK